MLFLIGLFVIAALIVAIFVNRPTKEKETEKDKEKEQGLDKKLLKSENQKNESDSKSDLETKKLENKLDIQKSIWESALTRLQNQESNNKKELEEIEQKKEIDIDKKLFWGEAAQDLFAFVLSGKKKNGTFLEIGANDPIHHSNTFWLEKKHDWAGIMVEFDPKFEQQYKILRPKSCYRIADARTIDYFSLLNNFYSLNKQTEISKQTEKNEKPTEKEKEKENDKQDEKQDNKKEKDEKKENEKKKRTMDYLQVDLDVHNASTLVTLFLLAQFVFRTYTFGTVTFEHDIYRGDYFSTRAISRQLFQSQFGYTLLFGDVITLQGATFEDWYVHPSIVSDDLIQKIMKHPLYKPQSIDFQTIVTILSSI